MMKIFYIFALIILPLSVFGQSITWQRYYDGPNHNDDYGHKIIKADEDNFYIIGNGWIPPDNAALYVVKINPYGQPLWSQLYYSGITGKSAISLNDGSCIVSGNNDTTYLLKLNPQGNITWYKTYYDSSYSTSEILDIAHTTDNGYIGCGRIGYDFAYIFKTDSLGNIQWKRAYSSLDKKWFKKVTQLQDGFLLVGHVTENGIENGKGTITKIDNNGNIVWEKKYLISGFGLFLTQVFKINNKLKLLGTAYNIHNSRTTVSILNADTLGNTIDTIFFDAPAGKTNELLDCSMINPDKFVLSSVIYKSSLPDTPYVELRLVNSKNNTLYTNHFKTANYNYINSILPIENGDLLFGGYLGRFETNNSDVYSIRTDSILNAPPVSVQNENGEVPQGFNLSQNYPNPFNPTTVIGYTLPKAGFVTLYVFDVNGKRLKTLVNEYLQSGLYSVTFNSIDLSSGIYFYELLVNDIVMGIKKMVLLK